MADIRIKDLHKYYGQAHALKGIDLTVEDGEFVVFVGPSGCGKSTLLRAIAGLEEISSGDIEIGGRVVTTLRPRDRDIAMVFQNYALYPFLSVYDNIAFGLRARKVPEPQIKQRVDAAGEMLGITALLARLPRQLSGGQRQRVAIGRAIVRQAQLFLFDEPLSNLDAKLRDEMRGEIKRLHREIATTMIYVTHDQIEAMTLADRIVLMRDGRIEQQGSPLELFERPRTGFVASFLGSPSINRVPATLVVRGTERFVLLQSGESLALPPSRRFDVAEGERPIVLGLRPQHLALAGDASAAPGVVAIATRAELVQPTGTRTYVTVRIGGSEVTAEVGAHEVLEPDTPVSLALDMNRCILIDPATDQVL